MLAAQKHVPDALEKRFDRGPLRSATRDRLTGKLEVVGMKTLTLYQVLYKRGKLSETACSALLALVYVQSITANMFATCMRKASPLQLLLVLALAILGNFGWGETIPDKKENSSWALLFCWLLDEKQVV